MNNNQNNPSQNSGGERILKPYANTQEFLTTLVYAYKHAGLGQERAYVLNFKGDKRSILSTKGTKCAISDIRKYDFAQFVKDYDNDPEHAGRVTGRPKLKHIKHKVPLGLCRQDGQSAVALAQSVLYVLGFNLEIHGDDSVLIKDQDGKIVPPESTEWQWCEKIFFERLTDKATGINSLDGGDPLECSYLYFSDYKPTLENEGETHISTGESS